MTLDKQEIMSALRSLGIRNGDLILVHSSATKCGQIDGGIPTIINAITESAGPTGTILFPTFTYPFETLGDEVIKKRFYKPYDVKDIDSIWVGNVPRAFLRMYPDAPRSKHITHSWAGIGPLADECTKQHSESAPPASADSPMGKALERGGKVLYFGCGLESSTFLHFLEDRFDLPGLGTAICNVKKQDGSISKVRIEKHLPGDRDFYRDAENCKFFRRAIKEGLEIKKASLGNGYLYLMDMHQLAEIGTKLIQSDRRIFLCDSLNAQYSGHEKLDRSISWR